MLREPPAARLRASCELRPGPGTNGLGRETDESAAALGGEAAQPRPSEQGGGRLAAGGRRSCPDLAAAGGRARRGEGSPARGRSASRLHLRRSHTALGAAAGRRAHIVAAFGAAPMTATAGVAIALACHGNNSQQREESYDHNAAKGDDDHVTDARPAVNSVVSPGDPEPECGRARACQSWHRTCRRWG
jgi:hypothetical protein